MILSSLPLKNGSIDYTDAHDALTASEAWEAWKNGDFVVFHMIEWQTRHDGYFTPDGEFVKDGGNNQ